MHRYAAGGALFAAVPLPVPTSPILAALETHLFGVIGKIYGEDISAPFAAAAGGTFTAFGSGLKFAATQAVGYVPVIGPVIRGSIAGIAIEAIGQAIVAHYERKLPGKVFTQGG